MLSLSGIRLARTKDGRRDRKEAVSVDAVLNQRVPDVKSLLKLLCQSLGIEVVSLIDTSPRAIFARITSAGPDLVCDFTLPSSEGQGPIAQMIINQQVTTGKARVFASDELFPVDASWCDFIPMDVTVGFTFLPLDRLSVCELDRVENVLKPFYLLLTSTRLDPEDLKMRALLCGSLLALTLVAMSAAKQAMVNRYLTKELNDSGKATCIASADGTLTSKTGWLETDAPPGLLGALNRALETKIKNGNEDVPYEITPEQWADVRARAYPGAESGTYLMIVTRERSKRQPQQTPTSGSTPLMRFMSSIAHEIKNPLTGIAAGVQYLSRKLGSGMTETETVEFILSEINRLNRIVDDLYRIARPPELNLTDVRLNEIVTKSLLSLSESILRKQLSLVQEFADVPEIRADPDRLQQVIINILKNAIEVSPERGTIRIATGHTEDSVWIRVTDEGPGIPVDAEETIFEPFYSTKPGGTGLGLSISRRIVEQHGGSIGIEHAGQRGVTFVVELPRR